MKKLLLTLLAVVLCIGVSVAQRRKDTEDVRMEAIKCNGVQTYSYIVSDGRQIFDGPVSIKGGVGKVDLVYQYWYRLTGSETYTLTANHSNGNLHGPISMKYSKKVSITNGESDFREISYSGGFANGLPNGRFKLSLDADYMDDAFVDVNYKNGIFVGSFHLKHDSFHSCDITGTFNQNGRFHGIWNVNNTLTNWGGEEKEFKIYEFQNGVLVGGDGAPTDPTIKDLTLKYANGKLSKKDLIKKGYAPVHRQFRIYGSRKDIYGFVGDMLFDWSYINYDELGYFSYCKEDAIDYYEVIEPITLLTEKGFNDYIAKHIHSGNIIKADEIISCNDEKRDFFGNQKGQFTSFREEIGLSYVWDWYEDVYEHTGPEWHLGNNRGYYMTEEQFERLGKEVEKHNFKIQSEKLKNYFKQNVLNIGGQEYTVISHKMVGSKDFGYKSITIEFDGRLKGSSSEEYSSYRAEVDVVDNEIKVGDFTPIRNKYSDIVDAKKAAEDEAKATFAEINVLENEGAVVKGSLLEKQILAFKQHYNEEVANVTINHKNLEETLANLKSEIPAIQNFNALLPKYVEASKLNAQIVQQQISKYTSSAMPNVATWSAQAKGEDVDKVIEQQKQVLKLWEVFAPLKAKVEKAHCTLAASNDSILSGYKSSYATATKKTSLEEAITAYTNLIPVQEKVLAQWNEYSILKEKGDKAHGALAAANDTILADYYKIYDTVANTKGSLEAGISAYNSLFPIQEKTLALWEEFSTLRKQANLAHGAIGAANTPVMGEYTALYDTTVKGITSLEAGIAAYNKIIATQQNATKFIAIYNEVVANHATLPTNLKPAKSASKAYKTYYEGLDLNWKPEGAVEKITKVWTIQQSLAKIPTRVTLKADEKRVKKAKLTDIEEIIKCYFNGEDVNVGEPKAEFVVKDVPEVKVEPQTEKKSAKATEVKVEPKASVKTEATPKVKVAKEPTNKSFAAIKPGFGQYLDVSVPLNMIMDSYSLSTHVNYIAGYRINKNFFLGVGTGVNLNLGHDAWYYRYYNNIYGENVLDRYEITDYSLPMITIPVYLNFRVDFGKRAKLWNPYASVSAGMQFGIYEPYSHVVNNFYDGYYPGSPYHHPLHEIDHLLTDHAKSNNEAFVSLDFGVNRRLSDNLSIYFGVGYKAGGFLRNSVRTGVDGVDTHNPRWNGEYLKDRDGIVSSLKFNIGLSF